MSNNLIFIVMDSCRFDSYAAARTPNMDRIGIGDRRYAYASWTSPSHYTYLMGMIPHDSPKGVFASEVYKKDFVRWVDRLGVDDMSFKSFVPTLSLPKVLQDEGYRTVARVSLPVLNPMSHLNRHFDDYKLMSNHNDFGGIIKEVEFDEDEPSFHFLNLGETHYPYMLDPGSLPHISGVHGVFKRMDDDLGKPTEDVFFDDDQMKMLHQQQIKTVEHVDGLLDELISKAPVGTHFIITADHGECFGEGGYFGHGPIVHEKVLEVPFLEGKKR
ncbi:metalloenzyme [Sinimarinibacterium sp. CAU 1509]|uniref:metalloenzyme n=1 Tax=Sinimarinibacterium sp. CAU 1509 TaxID=2562283 RepID=UPI0010AC1CCE|nr:metalloenzyme [Sinimarinibacterium sp. CAU 1509]TJY56717.1 metalloenzyme [Sinimarinibacterium sp. CAU 1509]